ncbi:MAG: tRNA uridine-5-carboxymethylaminomethyl(34) synthesis GTPase MnmE [Firmicutes bacterium]|nr:tRNA uridine-5-carboxymethylaminomethyl(34) synthesis GTPase MnmE [Bacillota bacterium]
MKKQKNQKTPPQSPPIVAISSPRGTGAISIIRLSGEGVHEIAKRLVTVKETIKPKFLHYGLFESGEWRVESGVEDKNNLTLTPNFKLQTPLSNIIRDEVMIAFFSAPNSYTGEDMVELFPHGGEFLTNEILKCFISKGCRTAENGEFSKRAFLNGKIDLTKAEAIVDLIHAQTAGEARIAFDSLSGGVKNSVQVLERELVEVIAKIAVCVDYPEEDLEEVTKSDVQKSVKKTLEKVGALIASYGQGRLLREGVRVALVGETNVGKSSLMNALLGHERSIVTAIAGTTRDYIEENFSIGGQKFVLIDTAGIRESDDEVENIGIERTKKMVDTADMVLECGVWSVENGVNEKNNLTLDSNPKIIIRVQNKIDIAEKVENCDIGISAKTGEGIEKLKKLLSEKSKELTASPFLTSSSPLSLISNPRHYEALVRAKESLALALENLDSFTLDCVNVDLTEALNSISSITGIKATDEVVTEIFKNFCVGK